MSAGEKNFVALVALVAIVAVVAVVLMFLLDIDIFLAAYQQKRGLSWTVSDIVSTSVSSIRQDTQ